MSSESKFKNYFNNFKILKDFSWSLSKEDEWETLKFLKMMRPVHFEMSKALEIKKDFLNKMCKIKKDLRSTSLNALMKQFIPMNVHSKYLAVQNSKEIGQHCNLLTRAALKDAILIKNSQQQ